MRDQIQTTAFPVQFVRELQLIWPRIRRALAHPNPASIPRIARIRVTFPTVNECQSTIYVLRGTEMGYAAMRFGLPREAVVLSDVGYWDSLWCYAMWGTGIGYAAGTGVA